MSYVHLPTQGYLPAREAAPASLFTQGGIGACLLGIASAIPVQTIGRLYVGEMVLMAVAPVVALLLFGLRDQYGKTARAFLYAIIVTWIGYVISDIIRGTPSADYLRGWARWIAMGASFAALAWLGSKNIGYVTAFLAGLALGSCLVPLAMGAFPGIKVYWKFYAGGPVCILTILFASRFRPWVSVAALLGLAVLSIALDSRSYAMLCILVAGIAWLAIRRSSNPQRIRTAVSKTSMVAAALMIVATAVSALLLIRLLGERYGYAERFERSNATRMVSATVTWTAIKQSPFIGYGSWPRDAELSRLRDKLVSEAKGTTAFRTAAQDELIIAHSQILQGWLEGGLLGLAFFGYLGWLLCRQLTWLSLIGPFTSLTPLIAFLQLLCAWNLVFSPFSAALRLYIPVTCVFICYVAAKAQELKWTRSQGAFAYTAPRFAGAM